MRIQHPDYLFLALFCLVAGQAAAQNARFVRADEPGHVAITAGVGVANYLGDLNERTALRRGEVGMALAAGLTCRLANHLSARGELRILRLRGSQAGTPRESNNLSFRSTNAELTGGLLLDLLPASAKPVVNPYLAVGVGFTYLSPRAKYENRWVSLPRLETEGEGYGRLAVLACGGAGVSVRLPHRLLLSLEVMHTLPGSDYVDDVSTVYPFASSLRGNDAIALADRRPEVGLPLREPGTQRGFATGKDTYLTALVRVTVPLSSARERQDRRGVNCLR